MNFLNLRFIKALFTGILLMAGVAAFSQHTVTGTVKDMDGNTIPGVNVTIQGTTTGTSTDVQGQYKLDVPNKEAVLVFSSIGFTKESITVGDQKTIDVTLMPDIEALSEIVVIGYGVTKKEDATGSVQAIDSRDFNVGAITAPQDLLTGKVAGVQITNGGGAPGEGATIRIRGGSSLSASNDPLIVVDGIALADGGISGSRNPLNSINPNDIETFTVLKDASATAIYGSRASNGVILITTKKSEQGSKLKIDYSGKLNIYSSNKRIDVLDANQFRSLITEMHPDHVDMLGTANTNWQDEIYQNAIGTEHHVSFSGAYKTLPYRASVGYSNNEGILKTDQNERITGAVTLNPTFLDDHLKLNINARGNVTNNTFADRGAIGAAVQHDPTQPVTQNTIFTGIPILGDTDWGGYYARLQSNGQPVQLATANPVALLEQRDDQSTVNSLIGNAKIDYKFHFLPELRANLNLGYDYAKGTGSLNIPQEAAFAYNSGHGGGTDNTYTQVKKNQLLDFYLNYVKEIAAINSKVDAMAGYSHQYFYEKSHGTNSNVANTPSETNNYVDSKELYLISFYGRLNYTLADKYLATITVRNDHTSRFSEDARSGLFPSLALGWKIHEESFLENVSVLSQLKLRLGWGVTGQQNIGADWYVYMPRYTYSLPGASYLFGSQYYQTIRPGGYDENIKWEETTTYNAALDYGFLNDRITGSVDVYYRKTEDLLNYIPVPAGSNLTNYINTNVGDLENKGIEFAINGKAISTPDMIWDIGFNMTYNKNKITKLTLSDDPDYLGVPTGGISGGVGSTIQMHSVGHPYSTFFVYEQIYDDNGDPIPGAFVDQNGDGQINESDRVHKKNPAPDVTFGINTGFSYKNWYLSFSGRASFGNYVYNNVESVNGTYQRLYRPEGPYLSNVTTGALDSEFENAYYLSDYYLQNASFFRMDNISLSYKFENLANQGINMTVSGTVNNAFVITKYDGIDPEIFGGIDNNFYPRPTAFVLGVNVNF
jgi:iron complex outermembrane receptor protein